MEDGLIQKYITDLAKMLDSETSVQPWSEVDEIIKAERSIKEKSILLFRWFKIERKIVLTNQILFLSGVLKYMKADKKFVRGHTRMGDIKSDFENEDFVKGYNKALEDVSKFINIE